MVGSPWIFVALPSSTVTSIAHVSGQSWGHATLTRCGSVSLMTSFYVEQFDPVPHRRRRASLQVSEAADVCRGDAGRRAGLERDELANAQLGGDGRLSKRVSAGRAAAQVRVVHGR